MSKGGAAEFTGWRHRPAASLLCCGAVSVLQAMLIYAAFAQAPAPGFGHGFLIDKHVGAGLGCAKCHPGPPTRAVAGSACLACHGGSYGALAAKTEAIPNPHASHRGEVPCGECHRVHSASVTLCNQCHSFDLSTP